MYPDTASLVCERVLGNTHGLCQRFLFGLYYILLLLIQKNMYIKDPISRMNKAGLGYFLIRCWP